jgi:hypothetical protein
MTAFCIAFYESNLSTVTLLKIRVVLSVAIYNVRLHIVPENKGGWSKRPCEKNVRRLTETGMISLIDAMTRTNHSGTDRYGM